MRAEVPLLHAMTLAKKAGQAEALLGYAQVTRASKAVLVGDYQVVREFCRRADGSVAVKCALRRTLNHKACPVVSPVIICKLSRCASAVQT